MLLLFSIEFKKNKIRGQSVGPTVHTSTLAASQLVHHQLVIRSTRHNSSHTKI